MLHESTAGGFVGPRYPDRPSQIFAHRAGGVVYADGPCILIVATILHVSASALPATTSDAHLTWV
jgi:hypothetical protein